MTEANRREKKTRAIVCITFFAVHYFLGCRLSARFVARCRIAAIIPVGLMVQFPFGVRFHLNRRWCAGFLFDLYLISDGERWRLCALIGRLNNTIVNNAKLAEYEETTAPRLIERFCFFHYYSNPWIAYCGTACECVLHRSLMISNFFVKKDAERSGVFLHRHFVESHFEIWM